MAEQDINSIAQDWQPLMAEFERRKSFGQSMGGEEKLAKREDAGRLNARQMITALVDDDSFMELGTLAGGLSYHGEPIAAADALVGGLATIDGRNVVVGVEDFTVMGGSIGHATNAKKIRLASLALQERLPFISLLEGSGERTTNALSRHPYAPSDMQILAKLSGIVPTVALIVGPSAGHGAITGMLKDFIVMTSDACLFAAGPPLVEAALGEKISKQALGGAAMHTSVSGVAHNQVDDFLQGVRLVRQYLSFFPASAYQLAAQEQSALSQSRSLVEVFDIVPNDDRIAYDMHKLIDLVVDDRDDCIEIQPGYGRSIITSLARIGGYPVAIVANQPSVQAGAITAEAADKAAHFIDVCNAFHLPIVFLADNPGVMSGSSAEQAGTLRSAARMYAAQSSIDSPKLHVTIRKAFGFGSSLMGMNPFDQQTLTLAFPGITLGGIPALGGGIASGADEDMAEKLKLAEQSGAWSTGDTMAYDEIIDPRELRNRFIKALMMSRERQTQQPQPLKRSGIRP